MFDIEKKFDTPVLVSKYNIKKKEFVENEVILSVEDLRSLDVDSTILLKQGYRIHGRKYMVVDLKQIKNRAVYLHLKSNTCGFLILNGREFITILHYTEDIAGQYRNNIDNIQDIFLRNYYS